MFTDGIVCSYVPSERAFHGLLVGLFDEFNVFQPEAPCIQFILAYKAPTWLLASNLDKNFANKNKRET